ncbi:MAG TPA: cytochrome b/b6 domain-containing protein [Ghiorsea sp.]|nr:cytochrome b/b6 domain-containing protein [Ghiorsea sp.]
MDANRSDMIQEHHTLEDKQGYHPVTRWLHAGLVLGVIFQLAVASMMAHPEHEHGGERQAHGSPALQESKRVNEVAREAVSGEQQHHAHEHAEVNFKPVETAHVTHVKDEFGAFLMQAHRTAGLLVVVFVFLNLIWAILRRGKPKNRQISVLFSQHHWCEALSIAKRLPLMLIGKSPMVESGNALALIVEMLGLLVMTAMALTGLVIWNIWAGLGSPVSAQAELLMQVHGMIAAVLFVYLAGHVSMALLHVRSGDNVFARIVPLYSNGKGKKKKG